MSHSARSIDFISWILSQCVWILHMKNTLSWPVMFHIWTGEESTGRNEPGTLVDRNHACLGKCCYCYVPWLRIQNLVFIFVSDPLFDLFITFCILVNTIFMGLEFHNMPDDLVTATSVANIVCYFLVSKLTKLSFYASLTMSPSIILKTDKFTACQFALGTLLERFN